MLLLVLPTISTVSAVLHNISHNVDLSGNVCQEKKVEVIPVNTTRMVVDTYTQWEDCWYCFSWYNPFQKKVLKHRLVPVLKVENITKVSLVRKCCEGFIKTEDGCGPLCTEGCGYGRCVAPYTCSCEPGYSGLTCQEEGCPPGSWGQDCSQLCHCRNGGLCSAVDGSCLCAPGYQGAECEARCGPGTFGANCSRSCNCDSKGQFCHHITGDCLRCGNNTYGENCSQRCQCHDKGTALCSHIDGRCFCEANWAGDDCHLHCPFGHEAGECLTAIKDLSCDCPSDLWKCDAVLGCVCPKGVADCGIESGREVVVTNFTQEELRRSETDSGGVIAVVVISLLVIGSIVGCVIVVYYRRRLSVMKMDLSNRTGQHNYTVDMNNDSITASVSDFNNETIANNPMYVVNYNPGKLDKTINITRQKLYSSTRDFNEARDNLNKTLNTETDNVYQEPQDVKKEDIDWNYDVLPTPRPITK